MSIAGSDIAPPKPAAPSDPARVRMAALRLRGCRIRRISYPTSVGIGPLLKHIRGCVPDENDSIGRIKSRIVACVDAAVRGCRVRLRARRRRGERRPRNLPVCPPSPSHRISSIQVIGRINEDNGAPQEHSSVQFHLGYVVEVYSEETFSPRAGIAVFDLADPTRPATRRPHRRRTRSVSPSSTPSPSPTPTAAITSPCSPSTVSRFGTGPTSNNMHQSVVSNLPGVVFGYGQGAWWLSWQAPYLYVSGASNGIFIVDVSDPANPVLADRQGQPNPIPNSQTGGFRVGPIFAVGNLLVASANDGRGYATLDISDPLHPVLLDAIVSDSEPSYSSMLNGNRLYAAGTDDDFHGYDISNPARDSLARLRADGRQGRLPADPGRLRPCRRIQSLRQDRHQRRGQLYGRCHGLVKPAQAR